MERGGGATEKESFFHLLPFLVAFLKLHAYATQQQNESDGLGDGGGGGRNRLTTLVVRRLNLVALLTFLSNFLPFFTRSEAGRRHWSRASPFLFLVLANGRRRRERPIGRREEKSEDEPLAQVAARRRRRPVVFPRKGDGTPDGFDGGEGKGERSLSAERTLTSVVRDKRRGADVRSRSSKGKFQFRVSPPTHTDERATRGHFEGSL